MTKEEVNSIAFQIIANAGVARSFYNEAYRMVKQKKFDSISNLIAQGDEVFNISHLLHADLIHCEASENNLECSLILIHAEDQLMLAEIVKQFVLELIEIKQDYLKMEEIINERLL